MINHLPECPWPDKPCGPDHEPMHDREPMFCVACLTECICERIKRAERRMREITLQSMDHSRCKWWEGWDSAFFAAEKALDALPVRFVPYENAGGYLTYGALDAANVRAALVALRDQTDADQIAVKYANSSNEEVQMIKHLPECQRWYVNMPEPDECPACEMFRACEQRVRMEDDDRVEAVEVKGSTCQR